MIKKVAIREIADIRFGYYAQPDAKGSILYLQARHFDDDGNQVLKLDEFINLEQKHCSHILQNGDVLFVGKGNRLFSWCYTATDRLAVASSVFFVLRPDTRIVYPKFLTAILNAPKSKAAFLQLGSGTNILSIRKSELGGFEIPLPGMSEQKKIAAFAGWHQQDVALTRNLILQKQKLYSATISNLLK